MKEEIKDMLGAALFGIIIAIIFMMGV